MVVSKESKKNGKLDYQYFMGIVAIFNAMKAKL